MPQFDVTSGPGTTGGLDELQFSADGSLPPQAIAAFDGMDERTSGAAVTVLVERVTSLQPMARGTAASSIEALVADALTSDHPIAFDVPGLLALYRSTSVDAGQAEIAGLIVKLLLNLDREEVFALIPLDAAGLSLRGRLTRALDEASGLTEPEAEHVADATRGIDFGATDRAEGTAGSDGGDGWSESAVDDGLVGSIAQPTPVPPVAGAGPMGSIGGSGHAANGGGGMEANGGGGLEANGGEPVSANGGGGGHAANGGDESAPASAEPQTYRAFGLLDCADIVLAGQTFPLEFGLAEQRSAGVAGPPLEVPRPEAASYTIDVQLFADGFDLAAGESWRHSLLVETADLFPTAVVHLTARDLPNKFADRTITATYSIAGETLGVAVRQVRVTKDEADVSVGQPLVARASGTNITAPTGEPKAHVTVTIAKGLGDGILDWGVESEIDGVGLPADRPTRSDIGEEPKVFAQAIIKKLHIQGTSPGLFNLLVGIGRTVAEQMPNEVHAALRTAAAAVAPQKLQVLLLTQEPFVPWELAYLEPPFDPGAPSFLGAQANVGRWILDPEKPTDPPRAVRATSMAVVWGVYKSASLPRLLAAEEEAQILQTTYRATSIDAEPAPVTSLLSGTPAADILHFAVHGKYDPQVAGEGIYLVSGPPVDPLQIVGSDLKARAPFVFLNACQVGSAQTQLGDYGGIAQAFLKAGASAVVAPLWSIDDKIAQKIALEFYAQALATAQDPATPGSAVDPPAVSDLLRQTRVALAAHAQDMSATYLAYQFYGHPTMRLSWSAVAPEGGPDG